MPNNETYLYRPTTVEAVRVTRENLAQLKLKHESGILPKEPTVGSWVVTKGAEILELWGNKQFRERFIKQTKVEEFSFSAYRSPFNATVLATKVTADNMRYIHNAVNGSALIGEYVVMDPLAVGGNIILPSEEFERAYSLFNSIDSVSKYAEKTASTTVVPLPMRIRRTHPATKQGITFQIHTNKYDGSMAMAAQYNGGDPMWGLPADISGYLVIRMDLSIEVLYGKTEFELIYA